MSDKLSFSQRMGYTPLKDIQRESMNESLRTAIWNLYYEIIDTLNNSDWEHQIICKNIERYVWRDFLKNDITSIDYKSPFYDELRSVIYEGPWYEVYNFVEFVMSVLQDELKEYKSIFEVLNRIMERENSAYRLIDGEITPITDEQEIEEIEKVLEKSKSKFNGVHTHLKAALSLLSNKENPNYRKSIDESITAIESICGLICGDSKLSLGKALNKIEREGLVQINGTLKDAYSKIYGYTSGDNGIRHAMTDEPNLDYEDAKYMLVSCTSFINYLIVKADKAEIFEGKS